MRALKASGVAGSGTRKKKISMQKVQNECCEVENEKLWRMGSKKSHMKPATKERKMRNPPAPVKFGANTINARTVA
jgi:hypothetical protein